MEVSLLGTFSSKFCDTSNCLTVTLIILNLRLDDFGYIEVLMKVVVHFGLDEIAHKLVYTHTTIWFHSERTEFDFGLRLELWFLHIDCNSSNDSRTDISIFIIFGEELLDGACNMLLESTLMSTSLDGVLTIYE